MLDYGKADINAPTATATQTRGEVYTHDASAARMQTRSGDENSLSRQYDEAKFPARSSESCSFTIEDDVTLPRTESEKKIRRSDSNSSSEHYMNCGLWTQRAAENSQCTETIRDHAGFRVHSHVSAACNGLWLSNASENHWQPPISSCESIPRNASRSIHPEHQTLIEYDDGNRPRQGACHGLTRGLATMPCPSSVSEYWNPEIETRMLKSSESTPDDHNAKSNKAGGHRNKQLRLKGKEIPKESTYVTALFRRILSLSLFICLLSKCPCLMTRKTALLLWNSNTLQRKDLQKRFKDQNPVRSPCCGPSQKRAG